MNSEPSDFTLIQGKVLFSHNDDDLPEVGKLPDTVHVYLWLVYYPDGIIASWDRTKIDALCFDMLSNGISYEFFSHVFVMSLQAFKQKFPNVPISNTHSKPEP